MQIEQLIILLFFTLGKLKGVVSLETVVNAHLFKMAWQIRRMGKLLGFSARRESKRTISNDKLCARISCTDTLCGIMANFGLGQVDPRSDFLICQEISLDHFELFKSFNLAKVPIYFACYCEKWEDRTLCM